MAVILVGSIHCMLCKIEPRDLLTNLAEITVVLVIDRFRIRRKIYISTRHNRIDTNDCECEIVSIWAKGFVGKYSQ